MLKWRCTDGQLQGHTGQPSAREIDDILWTISEKPLQAEASTIAYLSVSHTYAPFSDNGVYVALQQISLIVVSVVSDQ